MRVHSYSMRLCVPTGQWPLCKHIQFKTLFRVFYPKYIRMISTLHICQNHQLFTPQLRIGQDSDEDNDSVISTDPPSSPSAHDTPPPPQPTTLPPKTEDTPSEDAPSEDKLGELASEEKRRPSRHQVSMCGSCTTHCVFLGGICVCKKKAFKEANISHSFFVLGN